jgi:predicted nucleic acid-binding protein
MEIPASTAVRDQSIRLLRVHPLRAADALQLAAALIAATFQPDSLEFISLDGRQSEAAEREGFRVPAGESRE